MSWLSVIFGRMDRLRDLQWELLAFVAWTDLRITADDRQEWNARVQRIRDLLKQIIG